MKTFSTPIPSNNNAAGSGSPYTDVVRVVNALTEIRASVPSTASDIGAADSTSWSALVSLVDNLERSVNSFA